MRYIECPECQGAGVYEEDKPIVCYINGGYLETQIIDCGSCNTEGVIEDPDFNEDEIDF